MIAAVALSTLLAVPNPTAGLEAPLRMAVTAQWQAGYTWNETQRRQNSPQMIAITGASRTQINPRNSQPDTTSTLARIRACESAGNYTATSPDGRYRGAYQFDRQTWASVGGQGDPAAASPAEQDNRARMLYDQRGSAPWPVCG